MRLKNKKKLNKFDKCVFVFNCLLALALLLSYLAPFANPGKYWIIALLGLTYPLLLSIHMVFIIYWLFRSTPYTLISLGCILIGIKILLMNICLPKSVSSGKEPGSIRLMAYNVHGFGKFGKVDRSKTMQKAILQLINDEQPDIINLEEAYLDVLNKDTIYSSIKKNLHANYHYIKQSDFTQWDSTCVAIFSRFPIINKGIIATPVGNDQAEAIFADIKYKKAIFRVYCVHLQSTKFDDQDHLFLSNLMRHAKLSLSKSLALADKLKVAFIKRSNQVALIKQNMAQCPYPYIVAGDFNDTPISFTVNQLGTGLKSAFLEKGSGFGMTYFGDFPHSQIDYILLSPKFNIINYRIPPPKMSDHYAIISDFKFNPAIH